MPPLLLLLLLFYLWYHAHQIEAVCPPRMLCPCTIYIRYTNRSAWLCFLYIDTWRVKIETTSIHWRTQKRKALPTETKYKSDHHGRMWFTYLWPQLLRHTTSKLKNTSQSVVCFGKRSDCELVVYVHRTTTALPNISAGGVGMPIICLVSLHPTYSIHTAHPSSSCIHMCDPPHNYHQRRAGVWGYCWSWPEKKTYTYIKYAICCVCLCVWSPWAGQGFRVMRSSTSGNRGRKGVCCTCKQYTYP